MNFKVKSNTNVRQLATSISLCITEENKDVTLRAIGAGAVNQMYKALAVARGLVASKGIDLLIKPGFDTITENDETKTVMVAFLVKK